MNKIEEKQYEIFRKMPADKKIKLVSDLTMLVLELNKLGKNDNLKTNGKNKTRKKENT